MIQLRADVPGGTIMGMMIARRGGGD